MRWRQESQLKGFAEHRRDRCNESPQNGDHALQKNVNVKGYVYDDSFDNFGATAYWGNTRMAVQSQLGTLSKRWFGFDFGYRCHPDAAEGLLRQKTRCMGVRSQTLSICMHIDKAAITVTTNTENSNSCATRDDSTLNPDLN